MLNNLKQTLIYAAALFYIVLQTISLNIAFSDDNEFYNHNTDSMLPKMPPIFTDPILRKWPNHTLSGMEISAAMARDIAHGIDQNPELKSLELCRCLLTDSRILPILAVLRRNESLLHLDISFNVLHRDAVHQLSEMLLQNQTLESLSLAGCDFFDDEWDVILDGFSKNRGLKKLDMSHTFFTLSRAKKIAQSLAQHPTIESIVLQNCWLTSTMINIFSVEIRANASLRTLDFSGNPEMPKAMDHLAVLITNNPGLTCVKLNNCRLFDSDLMCFSDKMRVLKGRSSKVSSFVPTTLKTVLTQLSTPFFSSPLLAIKKSICDINFDGNCLTDTSLEAVQNALC